MLKKFHGAGALSDASDAFGTWGGLSATLARFVLQLSHFAQHVQIEYPPKVGN